MEITQDLSITETLQEKINNYQQKYFLRDIGYVAEAGDGIAQVVGLEHVKSQELVQFENGVMGLALNLTKDRVGVVIMGANDDISEGMSVHNTERILSIPVGEYFIGRVVDALGKPIDGKGAISCEHYRPIEWDAPGVVERADVDTPVQTGIKAIDAMVPIGRGQRELIIGDRQTGKTALAIDTIINQRNQNLICIYVAIGQKKSAVARTISELERYGAMEHTIVVVASADESAAMQYIAPYSGCAIGEEFMYTGKDALIIYDDLSKHAWAYRQLSLLLKRPPGREAYPGDVFYLHSRLLERAARLANKYVIVPREYPHPATIREDCVNSKIYTGPLSHEEAENDLELLEDKDSHVIVKVEGSGGSLTALPIIETLLGDVSAYIPTNVISITDGQIYLENDLFYTGIRPALNVGISVSRVGGDAQVKAMKKVASGLRLDMATFRELAAFAQLGSELEKSTQAQLNRGIHLQELLKQSQYNPMPLAHQVIVIFAGIHGLADDIEIEKTKNWEHELLRYLSVTHPDLVDEISEKKCISKDNEEELRDAIETYNRTWN